MADLELNRGSEMPGAARLRRGEREPDLSGIFGDRQIIGSPMEAARPRATGVGAKLRATDDPIASFDLASLDGSNGFRIDGIDANDFSGRSVSSAGDVNGDGFDDIVIGAYGDIYTGESYVVFGHAGGFAASLDLASLDGGNGFRLDGIDAGDYSGFAVSSAGDVNGDGFDDIVIGARGGDPDGVSYAGESYVVFGHADEFAVSLDLASLDGSNGFRIDGIDPDDSSGRSVSSAGDVNGDGFDDIVIGAPGGDPGGDSYAGESYLVFGHAGAFTASLDLASLDGSNGFRLDGIDADDSSGFAVSSAGDVNGDGFDDIVIGARNADPGGDSYAGASYVVFGAAGGFAASVDLAGLDGANGFRLDGIDAYDASGRSVSSAGDFNGDGFDDIVIGASGGDPGGSSAGESYVVFGHAGAFGPSLDLASLDGTNGFRLDGIDAYDFSGNSVSSAGDVNGDGFDDIVIGARGAAPGGDGNAGESYVIFGFATDGGTPANTDPAANDDAATTDEGVALTIAVLANDSDADGDTLSVIAVTAPGNGSVMVNTDGTITYTPEAGFLGDDSFDYTISDGNGGSDTASVTVTVNEMVDPPGNADPVARQDEATTNEDQAVVVAVLANDSDVDGDTLTVAAVTAPGNGSVTINANGTITYTPNGDFFGSDSFGYTIADGNGGADSAIVTVTVEELDDPGNGVTINAGPEDDRLTGTAFDDRLIGSRGDDTLMGRGGDDRLDGGDGFDLMIGGEGDDTLAAGINADSLEGGAGDDRLRGEEGRDTIVGGDGDDRLEGGDDKDELFGGAGEDTLIAGAGRDTMTGGADADRFRFDALDDFSGEAQFADRIVDFSQADGDEIDLRRLDAIAGGDDDSFAFIGNAAFSGTAGELRYEAESSTITYVEGDIDGDGAADFTIRLESAVALVAADFLL